MRFGKRLALATQNGQASEPYVSYKELKHVVGKLVAAVGSARGQGTDDEDGGSSDNAESFPQHQHCSADASASASSPAAASGGQGLAGAQNGALLEAYQKDFFDRLDADMTLAKAYVHSSVALLESALGDWQVSAISAGLMFTPEQLGEVSSMLPCEIQDRGGLVEWLVGLQRTGCPSPGSAAAKQRILDKYNKIAGSLNMLLQYIEVNLTAVRKILKKFVKKLPAPLRTRDVSEYKAHYCLCTPALQDLLRASLDMQLVATRDAAAHAPPEAAPLVVRIAQIGPESLGLLSRHLDPEALDALSGVIPARIDVYAKPNPATNGPSGAVNAAGRKPSKAGPAPDGGPAHPRVQQAGPAAAPAQSPLVPRPQRAGDAGGTAGPTPPSSAAAASSKRPCANSSDSTAASSANGEIRQHRREEQELPPRGGRKGGGKGGQGNRRGRKGSGQQPRHGTSVDQGLHKPEGSAPASGFVSAPPGAAPRPMAFDSSSAGPPSYFVPVYVGAGGCKGGGACVGRGGCIAGGKGGCGGRCALYDKGGAGSMEPKLDPSWLAGSVPMFWPPFGGMLPIGAQL